MKNIYTLIFALLFCGAAFAADTADADADAVDATDEVSRAWYQYPSNVAADGYDVVAYFAEENAVQGLETYTHEYGGQVWRFKNEANRLAFIEEPARYVPQYGGHCAYAAAQNALAFGDPLEWTVHEGQLYFNYSTGVRQRWEKRSVSYIKDGDRYWQDGLQEKASVE